MTAAPEVLWLARDLRDVAGRTTVTTTRAFDIAAAIKTRESRDPNDD